MTLKQRQGSPLSREPQYNADTLLPKENSVSGL